jgi:hypothetical protein
MDSLTRGMKYREKGAGFPAPSLFKTLPKTYSPSEFSLSSAKDSPLLRNPIRTLSVLLEPPLPQSIT